MQSKHCSAVPVKLNTLSDSVTLFLFDHPSLCTFLFPIPSESSYLISLPFVRSSRTDSTKSKAKKRRTRFPSPPPIIRYQTPFMNFLSSQDQPPVNSALPPPPPPPLSHDWPEEPCATRTIPIQSDVPFPWERNELISSQVPSFSSASSSFKLELNRTYHWRESYSFPPLETPVEELQQPQFPAQCWSAPPSGFGLFEDMQMQQYTSRDQFCRES